MHAERLGKYQLVQHLATGGMASVYLARLSGPGGFERHVVLKTLRTTGRDDTDLIPMFLDEARVVAMLHHQHISQVYEVGNIDGTFFLAMEYVHGETARDVLEAAIIRERMLPLAFGVTVVCAAAAGLHHAHERRGPDGAPLGIVHRDVTPSNVIISYDGAIKLIDFGIAKADGRSSATRTGFIKGKVGYMAPEQVRGHAVDRRSDVFALGVLAYELTTRRRAFAGASEFETLERTVHRDLVPPSELVPGYPAELEDAILAALELDPDDRYASADDMRRALERTAGALGLPLGEATVVDVLADLFGARPEPWLVGASARDDDVVTPVLRRTRPRVAIDRKFARGSGDHTAAPLLPPPPPTIVVAPTAAPVRSRRGARGVVIGVALAAAFAIGIAVVLAVSQDDDPRPSPPPPPPPPHPVVRVPVVAPPVLAPAPPPAPAVPATISLHVITDPPGATVVVDGVRLGTAPFTGELPRRTGLAWLKVRRSDRLPVRIQIPLDHDVSWTVRLPPRPR